MIALKPIGVIHSPYKSKNEAPFQGRWADPSHEFILEIFPEYIEGVKDLDEIKFIIVLYFCDRADRNILRTITPWSNEEKGVFLTRSSSRPNPIAMCVSEIIKIEGNKIYVRYLDAMDQSLLIDIKPYIPDLDNIDFKKEKIVFDFKLWNGCVSFHGHACPGLAIGYRASEAAVKFLDLNFSNDEEVLCITENNACGVDAIQYILGCTFGKGNLIFIDKGKQAFSFYCRDDNKAVRIVFKRSRNTENREEWMKYILTASLEELFEFKEPKYLLPPRAKIYPSLKCEECEELTSERNIRLKNGRLVCIDCFEKD